MSSVERVGRRAVVLESGVRWARAELWRRAGNGEMENGKGKEETRRSEGERMWCA